MSQRYRGKHKLGATGEFPQGHLNDKDEGELQVAIAADHENQVVRVDFGKFVCWLALPRKQALQWADMIRSKALQLVEE